MENPYFQYRESGQENLKCQNSFSICFFPLLLESHATFCLPSLSPISLRWTAEKEFNFILSFQVWLAKHDNDVEGEWKNWYTSEVSLNFNGMWCR